MEFSWDICEFNEAMRLFLLFIIGVIYASAPVTAATKMMQTVPSATATLRRTTFSGFPKLILRSVLDPREIKGFLRVFFSNNQLDSLFQLNTVHFSLDSVYKRVF